MHVPTTLEGWTHETVLVLTAIGRCEGERHDFKFQLPDAGTLTKIACALANSQGGFVVVGVKDRSGRFFVEGIQPDDLAQIHRSFERTTRYLSNPAAYDAAWAEIVGEDEKFEESAATNLCP